MNRWVLGVLALAAVGFAATYWQNRPAAGGAAVEVASPPEPAGVPVDVVDVIDLSLELELAPTKGEPFVPFDG